MELIIGVFISCCFLALYIVFFYSNSKVLSLQEKRYFSQELKKINTQKTSETEKIISFDILLHKIFQKLGYTGSFGEILKRNEKSIEQIDEIWKLHKLRNKLVHELIEIEVKEAEKYRKKYETIIRKYLS